MHRVGPTGGIGDGFGLERMDEEEECGDQACGLVAEEFDADEEDEYACCEVPREILEMIEEGLEPADGIVGRERDEEERAPVVVRDTGTGGEVPGEIVREMVETPDILVVHDAVIIVPEQAVDERIHIYDESDRKQNREHLFRSEGMIEKLKVHKVYKVESRMIVISLNVCKDLKVKIQRVKKD